MNLILQCISKIMKNLRLVAADTEEHLIGRVFFLFTPNYDHQF